MHPLLVGGLDAWPRRLEDAAALGFDAVGLPSVFLPAAEGGVLRVSDHDRPHPVLAGGDVADAVLRRLCEMARSAGLALFLDLDMARCVAGGALTAALPFAFDVAGAADALDPRRPPATRGLAEASWREPEAAVALTAWWLARLRRWADAGVGGFRCLAPAAVPASAWAAFTTALPQCRFVAWTPGTPRAALAPLQEARFAAACDSLAWWDGSAGWYADELTALASIGAPMATVEAPFGQRLAMRSEALQAARRSLAVAALAGGIVVPMGFEFGARRPFDPVGDTPADWAALLADPPADLRDAIRATNAVLAERPAAASPPRPLTGPAAPLTAWFGPSGGDLLLLNPDTAHAVSVPAEAVLPATGGRFHSFAPLLPETGAIVATGAAIHLGAGEARLLRGVPAAPIQGGAVALAAATAAPRVAIEAVEPSVDGGRFPVRRLTGQVLDVAADLICDGHDKLSGVLRWRTADATVWQETRLEPLGNDRWGARLPLERLGRHVFLVEAWVDAFASFRHGLDAKVAAGQVVTLELEEGRRLVAALVDRDPGLAALAHQLAGADDAARLALLRAPATLGLMQAADPRPHRAVSAEFPVDADRIGARFASWYELFPRSQSGDPDRHGGFQDVIAQLPRVREMGFDVLYFPPIHPIGRAFRKGRNNTLTPSETDVGSPYAIGSEAGGHDAIHPELGTLEDFRVMRDAAAAHGLELALDFAVQCSPDHPWLKQHPEWFAWRPDGSMRYAENPPKKYQDIVNVDFHAAGAIPDLWLALRDVVRFWADEGVRLFRVDNPHTKPLPFWEWLIAEIRSTDPDVVFLAEAFTRPKLMYRLAKLGFGQSYTYFTWRNEKREIMDYLTELTTTAPRDFFCPHFFVNTPDINPVFLQGGGRPAHLIRAALACTLSGLWGMYQGFELCDAAPLPGREEYLDSEKYQIRVWPDRAPGDIVDEITRLNAIRRGNPALQDHLGVAFHIADNDRVLWYRKRSADGTNVLLVAVSLDPNAAQEAALELPLWEWGLPDDSSLDAEELMRGERFTWRGKAQRLRLEPSMPFAIFRVRPPGPFVPHLPPVAAAPAPTGHG